MNEGTNTNSNSFEIEKQRYLLEYFLKEECKAEINSYDRIKNAPFDLTEQEEYSRVLSFMNDIPDFNRWKEFYEANKNADLLSLRDKFRKEPELYEDGEEIDTNILKIEAEMIAHNHQPNYIAKYLMHKYYFITTNDNEEMYYYKDGIYVRGAEIIIKSECKKLKDNISIHQANEVINHVRTATYISRDKINNNPFAIWLENGIYDWSADIFMDFSPKQIATFKIPLKYNKEATCPEIMRFLDEVISKEDVKVIQELFGYCLYKDYPIQKSFMFLGEGSNGKSTLINLFKRFLGSENISSISLQDFENKSFYMSQLFGKLANLYPDIPDISLKYTGKFKMLTGGDTIFADKKFKDGFNFVNFAKLIFSANKLPETSDDTKAFFRRWIFINFPRIFEDFERDTQKLEKISAPSEMSGLFNWAVEGLRRLLENQKFTYSKSTEELQDMYERLSNSLSAFIKDYAYGETDNRISKEDFYNKYINYCRRCGLIAKTKKAVGMDLPMLIAVRQIKAIPTNTKDGQRTPCWVDIAIKEDTEIKKSDLSVF